MKCWNLKVRNTLWAAANSSQALGGTPAPSGGMGKAGEMSSVGSFWSFKSCPGEVSLPWQGDWVWMGYEMFEIPFNPTQTNPAHPNPDQPNQPSPTHSRSVRCPCPAGGCEVGSAADGTSPYSLSLLRQDPFSCLWMTRSQANLPRQRISLSSVTGFGKELRSIVLSQAAHVIF